MKNMWRVSLAGLIALAGQSAALPPSNIPGLFSTTFEDQFQGSTLDTNAWVATDTCTFEGICRFPANVTFNGAGLLQLETQAADPMAGLPADFTTGRIDTLESFGPGFIEIRYAATAYSGINNSVFATGGASFGPGSARLLDPADFNDWDLVLAFDDFTLPTPNGSTGQQFEVTLGSGDPFPAAADLSDTGTFNTYGVYWTEANELIWFANGTALERYQIPDSAEFSNDVRWAIATAIRGTDFGIVDPNVVGTLMNVDFFRISHQNDILFAADSFDYDAGSIAGTNGGQGFVSAGSWGVESGTVDVSANSLTFPGLDVVGGTGDRVVVSNPGSPVLAERTLTTDTRVEANSGQDRWAAVLVSKDDDGAFNVRFRRTDGISRWGFGVTADEEVSAETQAPANTSATGLVPVNQDFLIVSRFDSNTAGNEVSAVAIYTDGDLLPASEDDFIPIITDSVGSTVFMTELALEVLSGTVEIGTVRVGTSLSDVLIDPINPQIAEEFDYTGQTALNGQGTAANGFAGAWTAPAEFTLSDDDVTIALPDAPNLDDLAGTGNAVTIANGSAIREYTQSLSLTQDDAQYLSFLAHQTGNTTLEVELEDTAGNVRWRAGIQDGSAVLGGVVATASKSLSLPPLGPAAGDNSIVLGSGFGGIQRRLATSINMGSNSNEYVFAALVNRAANAIVEFNFLTGTTARWESEIQADGTIVVDTFSAERSSTSGVAPTDETFLFLVHVDPTNSASSDVIQAKVFRDGDVIPTSLDDIDWDVTSPTGNTNTFLNTLQIRAGGGAVQIDEIILANLDVTGTTPEDIGDALPPNGTPEVTDTFDYAAGSLEGQNGGTGWSTTDDMGDPLGDYEVTLAGNGSPAPTLSVGTGSLDYPATVGGFAGETVLVLSRIQTRSSGADEVRVKVFTPGQTIPANDRLIDWDLIDASSSGAFVRNLRVKAASGPGGSSVIDEVKVGTTLASVTDFSAPAPGPNNCPGDTDNDNDADADDFIRVLVGFGTTEGATQLDGDFDSDGDVDADDFITMLVAFGTTYDGTPACNAL
ncbi:MAG: hypothetical protein AAGI30_07475 [Planctomycetota bacterium]